MTDPAGKPVAGADVEIWQANSSGRYAHPDDTNPAPLNPNFGGFGAITTGTDGYITVQNHKTAALSHHANQNGQHIFISTSGAATTN